MLIYEGKKFVVCENNLTSYLKTWITIIIFHKLFCVTSHQLHEIRVSFLYSWVYRFLPQSTRAKHDVLPGFSLPTIIYNYSIEFNQFHYVHWYSNFGIGGFFVYPGLWLPSPCPIPASRSFQISKLCSNFLFTSGSRALISFIFYIIKKFLLVFQTITGALKTFRIYLMVNN